MISQIKALKRNGQAFPISRLFDSVPDAARELLLGASQTVILKNGQILFQRGDAGGTMYIVQSGRIEISMVTETGKKVSFNLIGAGQCFGEISMVDQQPRTASALALEPASLIAVRRAAFFDAVGHCPRLGLNLMEMLCERFRWVSDSVEEYAVHSLHRRIARRLLVLHRNFANGDGSIEIAQSDLADFAGATREATNKILMEWKNDGTIGLGRRKIAVMNLAKLDSLACWDE
jgi:CRP/FNR family transcriptional regulator, cyclic AMP receptor protein